MRICDYGRRFIRPTANITVVTMTKSLACEAVVSEEVRVTAGLADNDLPQQEVAIRGRAEPMIVRSVTHAKTLSALVNAVDVAAA